MASPTINAIMATFDQAETQPPRKPLHYARRYMRTRASLRASIEQMECLETYFIENPDDASGFGFLSEVAGNLLQQTQREIEQFWNSSDCEGEG